MSASRTLPAHTDKHPKVDTGLGQHTSLHPSPRQPSLASHISTSPLFVGDIRGQCWVFENFEGMKSWYVREKNPEKSRTHGKNRLSDQNLARVDGLAVQSLAALYGSLWAAGSWWALDASGLGLHHGSTWTSLSLCMFKSSMWPFTDVVRNRNRRSGIVL